ncbi:hypothetical protein CAPN008_01090 [Capnocytophaga canis]|uniref:hypothetical protein n=1 Tax=Capnocytophaga canis TaxID=1848903 RepID=UPI001ACB6DC8|nr:hypothetical protein [Capnocytophaga canis]GIM60059.1 hypothetical protein CAPN008_01090 [Capnocytophaga canis]
MEKILHNFEKASIALVEAFAEKQGLDFDFFIGDNPAEVVSFSCEITFSLNEIWHDLSTDQPKGLIMEWFYENLEQYHKGNNDYINYYSWTLGKRYEDKEPSEKDKG